MRTWNNYLNLFPKKKEQFKELPTISIVGCFQNGKSTFVNCLLDQSVARTGDGRATTKVSTLYRWGNSITVNFRTSEGLQPTSLQEYLKFVDLSQISENSAFQAEIALNKQILKKIELIDTPGFDADEKDTEYVTRSLDEANYAIVVLTNERTLGEPELAMFECLKSKSIPYVIIMNCRQFNAPMRWYPAANQNIEIIKENEAKLENMKCLPDDKIGNHLIYPCNLSWYWYYINQNDFEDEDLKDDIEDFLDNKSESKENLLKLSNVDNIKSFFFNQLAHIN